MTQDGNRIASAASSGTKRFFELEQISINNFSRIEVFKSRTPDISAAGAYNFVGPDGAANSADDNLSRYPDLIDPLFSHSPLAATPAVPWVDTMQLYKLFVAHPEYLVVVRFGFRIADS